MAYCMLCKGELLTNSAFITFATCRHVAHVEPCFVQQALLLQRTRCPCGIHTVDGSGVAAAVDYGFDRDYSEQCLRELAAQQLVARDARAPDNVVTRVTGKALIASLTAVRSLFTTTPPSAAPMVVLSAANLAASIRARKPVAELRAGGISAQMIAQSRLPVDFFLAQNYSLHDLHDMGIVHYDWLRRLGLRLELFYQYRELMPIDMLVQDTSAGVAGAGVDFTHIITLPCTVGVFQALRAIRFTRAELGALKFNITMLLPLQPTMLDIKALDLDVSDAFLHFGFTARIYRDIEQRTLPADRVGLWKPELLNVWLSRTAAQ